MQRKRHGQRLKQRRTGIPTYTKTAPRTPTYTKIADKEIGTQRQNKIETKRD